MERKEFLKRLGFSTLMTPAFMRCQEDSVEPTVDNTADGTTSTDDGTCTISPTETAGPFPTHDPSSLVIEKITSDRTGVPLSVKLTIQDLNNGCEPLANVLVDIWHCDKDGYYSEYGGSGMQAANLTAYHFLRGRQTTNSDGQVGFVSIFPGWYSGRAPHIHVHIFDSTGKSLLITQIAFPTSVCDVVYTTATQYYTKGKQDTSNAGDNIFADSIDREMGTVTGSVDGGYSLTHRIVVKS